MLKALGGFAVDITGLVEYQGTWNANTNTPTLTSSVGVQGYYYVVNVAGTTNLNGITDWQIGDWAIFNGSVWQKVDNTDAVSSVNGQVGTVVLNAANVGAAANTVEIIAGSNLTGGGNLQANVSVALANTVSIDTFSAANVTVTSNLYANLAASNTAAMPDPALPLNPEGYISVVINGSTKKIPYYGV